jgi:hypothetical protein
MKLTLKTGSAVHWRDFERFHRAPKNMISLFGDPIVMGLRMFKGHFTGNSPYAVSKV